MGLDAVPMPLSQQADHLARLIHNHGKEARNIPSHDTHIQSIRGSGSRIRPTHRDGTARLLEKTDLRVDEHGRHDTAYAAQSLLHHQGRQLESRQDAGTEHRAIGPRIGEEGGSNPEAMARENLRPDHGMGDPIGSQKPSAINTHRSELTPRAGRSRETAHHRLDRQ